MTENLYQSPRPHTISAPNQLSMESMSFEELKKLEEGIRYVRMSSFFLLMIGTLFLLMVGMFTGEIGASGFMFPFAILGTAYLIIGFNLFRFKSWTRIPAKVMFAFMLFGFPLGTLIGAIGILGINRADSYFTDPDYTYKELKVCLAAEKKRLKGR